MPKTDKKKTTLPASSPWRATAKAATALRTAAQATKDACLLAEHGDGTADSVRGAAEICRTSLAALDEEIAGAGWKAQLLEDIASGDADNWEQSELLTALKELAAS